MKIYKQVPSKVLRFDIKQLDEQQKRTTSGKVITVEHQPLLHAVEWIKDIFKEVEVTITIKASEKPPYALVTTYEALGNDKGKSKSVSIYGMTAQEIYDHIMKHIEQ